MEIRGRCPACQARFKVDAKYAGCKLPCPKCQCLIDIPASPSPDAGEPPPVAAEPTASPPSIAENFSAFPDVSINTSSATKRGKAAIASKQRGLQYLSLVLATLAGIVLTGLCIAAVMLARQPPARPIAKNLRANPMRKAETPRPHTPPPELPSSAHEFPIGTAIQPTAVRGFDGWLQHLDEAKRLATAEKKDLLIVFGCSDLQPATQQLAAALNTTAIEAATSGFVRVIIDYPRTPAGHELLQDAAQNSQLSDDFHVTRLPALALADDHGRPYAMVRQWNEGFGNLADKLAELHGQKEERDQLLASIKSASTDEQLTAAARALRWLESRELVTLYRDQIDGWLHTAQRVDPANQAGLLEMFFEPLWYLRVARIRPGDATEICQVTAELDPWISRKFHDADRGVKLHLAAARLLQTARQFDAAARQMEQATRYQPTDANLLEALAAVRQILENKDVASSGTGFLISSGGYVLTNRHVIAGDGATVIRIPGTKDTVAAEIVAQDADLDIALLKVKLPKAEQYKLLAILAGSVRRGAAVAGFGYPLGDTLGSSLKLSEGVVSALPDESNSRYLLDLRVNPGNSGGPLCDRRGNVVGMISEKTGSAGIEDSYGLAIPAAELVKFLDHHLPAAAARPPADKSATDLGWDKVDERVSSGVLMVVKLK
jgi:S1-C subfamily serine protease